MENEHERDDWYGAKRGARRDERGEGKSDARYISGRTRDSSRRSYRPYAYAMF